MTLGPFPRVIQFFRFDEIYCASMFDEVLLNGVKLFGPHPADARAALFADLPAMRNAPRYDDCAIEQLLPASGIGEVESSVIGPIIVTPFSVVGGYMGQFLAEQDALKGSESAVQEGKTVGDLVYFGERVKEERFYSAVDALGVKGFEQTYAAIFTTFFEDADLGVVNPIRDGVHYLEQVRIICPSAMHHFYDAFGEACVEQSVSVAEALWNFYQSQISRYNPEKELYPANLSGVIGGDGDYEREQLAFGMLVENREEGIYRIWSRAYLCTK